MVKGIKKWEAKQRAADGGKKKFFLTKNQAVSYKDSAGSR